MLWGRLRRQNSSRQGVIVANKKGHNWIFKLFKKEGLFDPETKEKISLLVEMTSFENRDVLPADTFRNWLILKDKAPKIFNRFVMNSDDEDDVSDYIIHRSWAENAVKTDITYKKQRYLLSCDPARFGDDEIVIYVLANEKISSSMFLRQKDTMHIAAQIVLTAEKSKVGMICIDEIGVGGGVVDRVQELVDSSKTLRGIKVIGVNSASSAKSANRYINLRAEMWDYAKDLFEQGLVNIPDDQKLIDQLCAVKYDFKGGRMKIQSKDDIKKEIQESPDRADALVQALYYLKDCPFYMRNLRPRAHEDTTEEVEYSRKKHGY
jgi:hypothetical protein